MNDMFQNARQDPINEAFRDGAELVIVKPDYAYVRIGSSRFYFSGIASHEKKELFGGETVTTTTLPYDGWEKSIGHLGKVVSDE